MGTQSLRHFLHGKGAAPESGIRHLWPGIRLVSLRSCLILSPAEEAIACFEESSRTGVWAQIPKAQLIDDIRRNVKNPFQVNQRDSPMCGPAAIVFELVSRRPERYVAICQELYETGRFMAQTKEINPSDTLRESEIGRNCSAADWMFMATLRDVANILFPVEASSSDFVMGLSTPGEMEEWASEILGFDKVDYTSTYVYGEFDAMREAAQARKAGGVAFLMVNSALCGKPDPIIDHPDHWVSFLGGLSIGGGDPWQHDSGHITFDCYTWGTRQHIDIGEGPFEDYMWGVVTGT